MLLHLARPETPAAGASAYEQTANAAGADDNDGGGSEGDSIEALLLELD